MVDVIVGVDCATQPKNVGLARAVRRGNGYEMTDVLGCGAGLEPIEVVLEWLQGDQTALLTLDAPLGWPSSLGRELARHSAGAAVKVPPELLFRRVTDRQIGDRTGRMPLEVGADRIARTAHSALLFLHHLRVALDEAIPLGWVVPVEERVTAIEVYPAATLRAQGLSLDGYRKSDGAEERSRLLEEICDDLDCTSVQYAAVQNPHCFDALVCVVAGMDFLDGRAVAPEDREVVQREGWIWCRASGSELERRP